MSSGIFWLASYPKSGNTWLRSYIFALKSGLNPEATSININSLDTGAIASSRNWLEVILGLDLRLHTNDDIESFRTDAYRFLHSQLTEPSYHKIHDANHLTASNGLLCPLDSCSGALYLVRNPFDVAVSFANHMGVSLDKSIHMMGDPEYALLSKQHKFRTQVRQKMGTWSDHVSSWLDSGGQILWVRYEDMLKNPIKSFTQISQFLNLPESDEAVRQAIDLCHFDKLQKQEQKSGFKECPTKSNGFFRNGKVGDWRNTLSASQIDRIITDHSDTMQRLGYLNEQFEITVLCYPDDI